MQKETTHTIFHVSLIIGLLLIGGGVYLLSQQVRTVSDSVKQIENREPKAEQPNTVKDRQVLTYAEANDRLLEMISIEETTGWNTDLVSSKLEAEPLSIEGRTLHIPFDMSWGNAEYQLDTFDFSEGQYLYGPMYFSELHGANRGAAIRVRDARSLDAALADQEYTTQNCSMTKTFKPSKVKVRNVDAVRFEGEACEALWVGYEIQFGNKNLILVTGPEVNESLVRFVLERM